MVTTNPMRMLTAAGIGFEAREYQYDESDLSGVHAAAALTRTVPSRRWC